MPRCQTCPVPEGTPCQGEAIRNYRCDDPRYRAYYIRLAQGEVGRPHSRLVYIIACDYRIPLARLRDEGSEGIPTCGCGLTAVCLAGRSERGDGLVGRECHDCPFAGPRT